MALKDRDKFYSSLVATDPNQVSRNLKMGDRSWVGVVGQTGLPNTDAAYNMTGELGLYTQQLLGLKTCPSGFLRAPTRADGYSDYTCPLTTDPAFVANAFYLTGKTAIVAGFPVVVEFTATNTADTNIVQLTAPSVPGAPPTYQRTDFVFLEVWQTLVAQSPRASGTIEVTADPGDGDVVTVDGIPVTARLAPGFPNEFLITVGNTIVTAAALAACINLNVVTTTNSAGGTDTVTVKAVTPGAAGNLILLATTAPATFVLSGAALTGGADRLHKPDQETVYRHGNVLSSVAVGLPDDIADPTIDVETEQRIQVQYRIRASGSANAVAHDVNPDGFSAAGATAILAQGSQAAPVALYPFVPADNSTTWLNTDSTDYGVVDNGLWIAGDGSSVSAVALGTLDGFVYAIPICMVFRRNDDYFDPLNNTNGGLHYNHALVPVHPHLGVPIPANTSDRPDGAFNDAINIQDILDLRRSVSPSSFDLKMELQHQMQSLLDGNYKTWAIDGADKQTLGNGSGDISTQHLVCNEVGRSGPLGGVAPVSGTTNRGVLIRNFDHVSRRFGDQPVSERVVVAFYPRDRQVGTTYSRNINASDNSNPVQITTATAHGLAIGDPITIAGALNVNLIGAWVVNGIISPTIFTIPYDATLDAPAGIGGTVVGNGGPGVINNGKYVVKNTTGFFSQYRWEEGDALHWNLANFSAVTSGATYDGGTPISGAPPTLSVTQCMPPGTIITDVVSIYHDEGNYDGPAGPMDQHVQPTVIVGLGTDHVTITLDANPSLTTEGLAVAGSPEHQVVLSLGDAADQGSERRIFIEFEVQYPLGSGLTDTPDVQLSPAPTVFPYGRAAGRNQAIFESDQTQRPGDMAEPLGQMLREGYRETALEYVANNAAGGIIIDTFVSRNTDTLIYPRRVYGGRDYTALYAVADGPAGTNPVIDAAASEFGSSSRKIVVTGAIPISAEQTACTVTYYSQDPIPNYGATGYQISCYFRSNAPQTAGTKAGEISNAVSTGTLPTELTVEPLLMDGNLWTGQRGMGNTQDAFPYTAPLDQIPINDGVTVYDPAGNGLTEEWYFAGLAHTSIADFESDTGLLALHPFVQADGTNELVIGGAVDSQRPRKDLDFRAYYPYTDATSYRPTIISQNLSGIVRHKVMFPFLARATADAKSAAPGRGILFRKNELLLLVASRFAELDDENNIQFDDTLANNRCSIAVYRTRNLILLAGE